MWSRMQFKPHHQQRGFNLVVCTTALKHFAEESGCCVGRSDAPRPLDNACFPSPYNPFSAPRSPAIDQPSCPSTSPSSVRFKLHFEERSQSRPFYLPADHLSYAANVLLSSIPSSSPNFIRVCSETNRCWTYARKNLSRIRNWTKKCIDTFSRSLR